MPELPEVETVLRGLVARALGRRITAVEIRHPGVIIGSIDEFAAAVAGGHVRRLERKGKALAMELSREDGGPPRYLLLRLGMTGQFVVGRRGAPILPHPHA